MHTILKELDEWLDKKIDQESERSHCISELYEKYGDDARYLVKGETEDKCFCRAYAYKLVKDHIKHMGRRKEV